MGEPAVFTLSFSWFFGAGIAFMKFNGVWDISLSIPFVHLGIYCKKSKDNDWFNSPWKEAL